MRILAAALLASAAFAAPASAAPLFFNFVGTNPAQSVSFTFDSDPVPTASYDDAAQFDGIVAQTSSGQQTITASFFNQQGSGGFSFYIGLDFIASTTGPVIFTGDIFNPTFSAGVFQVSDYDANFPGGTLTITDVATPAVPEPATWAMMIGGFGLVGGAMRRRRVTSAITYA